MLDTLANTTDKQPCLSDCMIRKMGCLSLSGQPGFLLSQLTGSFHKKITRVFDILELKMMRDIVAHTVT